MTFATPQWLWALLVVPAVVAVYVAARRRRARRTQELAAQGLLVSGPGRRQGWRRNLPFTLFAAALALLAVAVARPMATVRTPRLQSTVILAMDVSNSMGAKDVKPSRIEAAKLAASDFVRDQSSSVKIGVVAFGPSALIVQTPTFDHPSVLRAISDLSLGGGTSVATGILTSLDALAGKTLKVNDRTLNEDNSNEVNIGYFGGATIVLISDGEDTSQVNPVTMARLASSAGVRIQTIGVGTVAGTTVQIGGFSVATALDPQTLEGVAKVTNGAYHQVADRAAVREVSRTIDLHFTVVTQYIQISAIFAAAALFLLAVGALLSVLWFGRVM
jgi:Ca-activated chloride channel family protein